MQAITQVIESAMQARDPYTVGHQQRVTRIAGAIADEMGLSGAQRESLHLAGTLHDLGKITVPAEILVKPGNLTDMEFAIIKTHPLAGYEILKPLEFPRFTTEIILQHHERFNGSGYPQGLAGEEIHLEARILGVADVVEAMATHRPYRPGLGIDQAMAEISRNQGILYDPQVVAACSRLYVGNQLEICH